MLIKSPTTSANSGTVASVGGRSDNHLLLSGITVQKSLVGREQHHKRSGALSRRQRAHRVAQFGSQIDRERRAPVRQRDWPRAIGRYTKRSKNARQLAQPVSLVLLTFGTGQHRLLPSRMFENVAHRTRRGWRAALPLRRINLPQIVQQQEE